MKAYTSVLFPTSNFGFMQKVQNFQIDFFHTQLSKTQYLSKANTAVKAKYIPNCDKGSGYFFFNFFFKGFLFAVFRSELEFQWKLLAAFL